MWTKNQGLNTAKEAALDIKTRVWTGRFINEAASKGNEAKDYKATIKFIKPWKLFFGLVEAVKNQDVWQGQGAGRGSGKHGHHTGHVGEADR